MPRFRKGDAVSREKQLRKQTFALQESEARYRALVNHSLTGILIITSNEIRFANDIFEKITGYTQEDIKSMRPWQMVHPSEREKIRKLGLRRLQGKPTRDIYETIWIHKSGRPIWVEVRATLIKEGVESVILVNMVDITARKKVEERLRLRIELEAIITSISTNFINIAPDRIDFEIEDTLRRIVEFSGFDRGYIFHFNEDKTRFEFTHGWWKDRASSSAPPTRIATRECPLLMEKLRLMEEIQIHADELPLGAEREGEIIKTQKIKSFIAVPLVYEGELLGFLGLDSIREKTEWFFSRLGGLRMIGQIIVNAIKRRQTLEALKRREEELRFKTRNLEEVNVALKVLLEQRESDKQNLERRIADNVKELLIPFIRQLRESGLDKKQATLVEAVEVNINQITKPFLKELTADFARLTPRETRIAELIKIGKTSKEISQVFDVSCAAVDFHRHNIRKKLGLSNKKVNLRTYLNSINQQPPAEPVV